MNAIKRFKIVPAIAAIILVISVVGCSTVRYDEGYDSAYDNGFYHSSPYYGIADPYSVNYYAPSPYYSNGYSGRYYRDSRINRKYSERRESSNFNGRRDAEKSYRDTERGSQQKRNGDRDRDDARNRLFGQRH